MPVNLLSGKILSEDEEGDPLAEKVTYVRDDIFFPFKGFRKLGFFIFMITVRRGNFISVIVGGLLVNLLDSVTKDSVSKVVVN